MMTNIKTAHSTINEGLFNNTFLKLMTLPEKSIKKYKKNYFWHYNRKPQLDPFFSVMCGLLTQQFSVCITHTHIWCAHKMYKVNILT